MKRLFYCDVCNVYYKNHENTEHILETLKVVIVPDIDTSIFNQKII